MARKEYLYTSESYSEGHPDKMSDIISDTIVDAYLEKDIGSQIDVNVFITNQKVIIGGKVKSKKAVDIEAIVRNTVKEIGYTDKKFGFDYSNCSIEDYIHRISNKDSNMDKVITTKGQKLIFGYAINDSDAFMPLTITLAHAMMKKHSQVRKEGEINFLYPEAKSQVTLQYDSKGKPKRIASIVYTTKYDKKIQVKEIRKLIMEEIIRKAVPNSLIDKNSEIYINNNDINNGSIEIEVGISGRKTISDTYGSWCRFGDSVLSGKDPATVERAVSYMLRKIAKNIVASGLTRKIEIQAAYAPGIPKPIALYVDSFETGKVSDDKINKKILGTFDLNPESIIEELDLLVPKYKKTACYGHFGRYETSFTWEMIDRIDDFK